MSFQFPLSRKERATARSLAKLDQILQLAYSQRNKNDKLTQKRLAELLGIDRSAVHRRLQGGKNLTCRTIAEMLTEMEFEIGDIDLVDMKAAHDNNHFNADVPSISYKLWSAVSNDDEQEISDVRRYEAPV